jgi:predicted acyl esterase
MTRSLLLTTALLAALLLPAAAQAQVPAGAEYSQTFIASPDGESLHADVFRPKGLAKDAKTPVIAVISPYLSHAPQDPTASPQPNARFNAFFEGAKVFEQGYTVVLADLRGSGGSSGCLDILGPGEQSDIKTIVEWAATQPWSTGKVGMYGKSYDGNTGVAGAAIRPKGLAAVVAQQVVGDRYSGSYSGGVRYLQSAAYPFASYGSAAELHWTLADDQQYIANSAAHSADCQAGLAGHYDPNPNTDFWKSRNFVEKGRGSTVPFLMTHGFLDVNTNIGAKAIDFYQGLRGPKRLWLGWWDHVRGDDKVGEALAMGREGWYAEVMRFYDEHLKGRKPETADPTVAVQGSDGTWRAEADWPPADAQTLTAPLKPGSYSDDANNVGSNDSGAGAGGAGPAGPGTIGAGAWTVSPPLPHPAHVAGIPTAKVDLTTTAPQTNLAVNVYDIAPGGKATMISRGARLVDASGPADLAMYPTDWTFPAGHRIGVLVSGANAEAYIHTPTQTTVTVNGGTIALPFLRLQRPGKLEGTPAPRLATYREKAPFDVDPAVLAAPAEAGLVPLAQLPPLASVQHSGPNRSTPAKTRITVRLKLKGRRATVTGRGPKGSRIRVKLVQGKKTLAARTVKAHRTNGTFKTVFKLKQKPKQKLRVRATPAG